jgi:hypothetical protein
MGRSKKILIGLSTYLAVHQISAMECTAESIIPISPSQHVTHCYFELLPHELLNYIAEFLPFNDRESEEEFIARTRIPKKVPREYYQYVPVPTEFCIFKKLHTHSVVFSADETKIALYMLFYHANETQSSRLLTIFDLKTKQVLLHDEDLPSTASKHIALSRSGDMFAYIQSTLDVNAKCVDDKGCSSTVLVIKNNSTKATQQFVIRDSFYNISSVDFNKQETHMIVHGIDYNKLDTAAPGKLSMKEPLHHLIFPLQSKESNMQNTNTHKNTLEEYFRRCRVCNKIGSTLVLKKEQVV